MKEALDDILKTAQPARLIPTVADSRKEERIVSILLATLSRAHPFAKQLLERCGQRVGKSSTLNAYTEVDFPSGEGTTRDRPDGILCFTTRKTRWVALIEAKVDNAEIDQEQIQRYTDLAKRYSIDAIITLSNQLVPLPTHVPYTLSKRITNQVKFFHFSWVSIATYAHLILQHRDTIDTDQAYILREATRYFDHDSSGIRRFERMNGEWRTLVFGIRDGQQFKWSSPEIQSTVASWHQEERDICLILSRLIGEQVSLRGLSRKHQADPARRLRDACDTLAASHELHSAFGIPNAASELELTVDLQRRTISCSMKLNAPMDKKRASARINWVRRQLRGMASESIKVRAFWPGRAISTQAPLSEVKMDSKCLENERAGMVPTGFEVVMVRDIGGRFPGRRTFIEELEKIVPEFYDEVGQHLRAWSPPPPSIAKDDPIHETELRKIAETHISHEDPAPYHERSEGQIEQSGEGSSVSGDPLQGRKTGSPERSCSPSTQRSTEEGG